MKEKRLVISMACGETSRKYAEVTFPLTQKYAQKCNADFFSYFVEDEDGIPSMKWDFLNFLDRYDRILYIDADMIVRSTTPDLFNLVPEDAFAGVNEYLYQNLPEEHPPICRLADMTRLGPANGKVYINVGMYMFSKTHRYSLGESYPKNNPCYFKEQAYINWLLINNKVKVLDLGYKFNYMLLMEKQGLPKDEAHIIHYAGSWGGLSSDDIINLMKLDTR